MYYSGNKTGIEASISVNIKPVVKEIVRVKSTGPSGLGGKPTKSSQSTINKDVSGSYGHQITAELDKALSNKGD